MKIIIISIILLVSLSANSQTEKYRPGNNKAITRKDVIKVENNSKENQYILNDLLNKNFSKKIKLPSCEITDTFNVLINAVLMANIKVQLYNDSLTIETTPTEIFNNSSIYISKNNYYRLNTRFIDAFRDFDNKYVVKTIDKIKTIKADSLLAISNSIMLDHKDDNDLAMKIENMNNNMKLCHDAYRSGTICIVIGTLMNITSSFLLMNTSSNSYGTTPDIAIPILIGVSGIVLSSVGNIIQIDSHKYLGKGYEK